MRVLDVESPSGLARVHLRAANRARAWLLLGHGAGGGVEAPDLVAASEAALAEGVSVGLVEQPYRVAGRRSPAPAGKLDSAWMAVVSQLRERELRGMRMLVGAGRWVRGLPAARLPSQMLSGCCVWLFRCSPRGERARLRQRAGFRNSTP